MLSYTIYPFQLARDISEVHVFYRQAREKKPKVLEDAEAIASRYAIVLSELYYCAAQVWPGQLEIGER